MSLRECIMFSIRFVLCFQISCTPERLEKYSSFCFVYFCLFFTYFAPRKFYWSDAFFEVSHQRINQKCDEIYGFILFCSYNKTSQMTRHNNLPKKDWLHVIWTEASSMRFAEWTPWREIGLHSWAQHLLANLKYSVLVSVKNRWPASLSKVCS